ncbi:MAG: hypothetical protein J6Q69_05515 [Clostridia bacterium]|nr:hypothetical protein [Clostridia bacterium]
MTFDKERYELAAKQGKTDFIIKVVTHAILIAVSISIAVLMYYEIMAVVTASISALWLAYSLYRMICKAHPSAIFSREYEGKIVKIHVEKLTSADEGRGKTAMAEIYIAKNATEVEMLKDIPKKAAECYHVGDRVFHIKGTRCPVILDRDPSLYACPLCASVITNSTQNMKKCPQCGR